MEGLTESQATFNKIINITYGIYKDNCTEASDITHVCYKEGWIECYSPTLYELENECIWLGQVETINGTDVGPEVNAYWVLVNQMKANLQEDIDAYLKPLRDEYEKQKGILDQLNSHLEGNRTEKVRLGK